MDTQNQSNTTLTKLAGRSAIISAVSMFIGAAFYFNSGTDLWLALANDEMAEYLSLAGDARTLLIFNISFWILGVGIMGIAGNTMSALCQHRPGHARIAQACYAIGVPLAIIAFLAMLALVIQLAPGTSDHAAPIATVVGWIGARADDIATVLLVGIGPMFLSLAARNDWMPGWLVGWGYIAGLVGIITLATIYFPKAYGLGMLIIPIGLGWLIATGIVLLRK